MWPMGQSASSHLSPACWCPSDAFVVSYLCRIQTTMKHSSHDLLVYSNGTVKHSVIINARVDCEVNLFNYPFAADECPVAIQSWTTHGEQNIEKCVSIWQFILLQSMNCHEFMSSEHIAYMHNNNMEIHWCHSMCVDIELESGKTLVFVVDHVMHGCRLRFCHLVRHSWQVA